MSVIQTTASKSLVPSQSVNVEQPDSKSCIDRAIQWVRKCEQGTTGQKVGIYFFKILSTLVLFASVVGIPLLIVLYKTYTTQNVEQKYQSLAEELKQKDIQIKKLTNKDPNSEDQAPTAAESFEALKSDFATLQEHAREVNKQKREVESRANALAVNVKELETAKNALIQDKEKLESQTTELTRERTELAAKIDQTKTQLEQTKMQLEQTKGQMQQAKAQSEKDLSLLQTRNKEVDKHTDALKALQAQLETKDAEITANKGEVQKKNDLIETLRTSGKEKFARFRKEIDKLRAYAVNLMGQKEKLAQELEQVKNRLAQEQDSASQEKARLAARLQIHLDQLDAKDASIATLVQKSQELEQLLGQQRQRSEQLSQSVRTLETRTAELERTKRDLEETLKFRDALASSQDDDIKNFIEREEQLRTQKSQLEQRLSGEERAHKEQVEKLAADITRLREEITQREDAVNQKNDEVFNALQRASELTAINEKQVAELGAKDTLIDRLGQKSQELDELFQEQTERSEQLVQKVGALKGRMAELEKTKGELSEKLAAKQSECERLAKANAALGAEEDDTAEELSKLSADLSHLSNGTHAPLKTAALDSHALSAVPAEKDIVIPKNLVHNYRIAVRALRAAVGKMDEYKALYVEQARLRTELIGWYEQVNNDNAELLRENEQLRARLQAASATKGPQSALSLAPLDAQPEVVNKDKTDGKRKSTASS